MTGSTQCHACPATTRSKARPAASHASNEATSTTDRYRRANGGHAGVGLEPQDGAAPLDEEAARLGRAGAEVEHVVRRVGGEVVDERRRVRRPGPVVLLGVGTEGRGAGAVLELPHERGTVASRDG
jgi:hypothetical protein